jgi:hypothetical protein
MLPTRHGGVVPVEIPLRPDELVGAWRPDSRRLLLATREPLKLGQRVAARITAIGRGAAATITGRVVSSTRVGAEFLIELVPDETRMRALERLLAIARGEPVAYRARAPRYLAAVPAVVRGPAGPIYMNTFSVSERGCGLAWSGPVPAIGVAMEVRLGAGSQAATFRGIVCWTAQSGRAAEVGVRFERGAQGVWSTILADLRSSGAPPA